MKRLDNELLIGRQSEVGEARGLYKMLFTGSTVEELRELIAVTPKTERILRGFALEDPEDAYWIEASLRFRHPGLPPLFSTRAGLRMDRTLRFSLEPRFRSCID